MIPNNINSKQARFALGQIVATPGALRALEESGQPPIEFLSRHATGDWGDLGAEDKQANDDACAQEGNIGRQGRILSSYCTRNGTKFWIITEYDRSVTTILLPEEY